MTADQPAAPAAPAAPRAEVGAPPDLANQIDKVNKAVEEAGRRADARAAAAAVQAGPVGVVKNATGQIVVTGPNGKQIIIDPRAGLNGDQIQEMVQTALQPTPAPFERSDIPKEVIPIVGIIFPCLMLMVFAITRAITRRPVAAGLVALPPETAARLARIEQAVEAVAIEVERISEAQRYSAQLLTDRLAGPGPTAPAMSAGARTNNQ